MTDNALGTEAGDVQALLANLGPEPGDWVPAHDGVDHDVVIVGAGQSGVAAAFALRRLGIAAYVIDAAREGDEGVWRERARMTTLRTPKWRPGPELGIPELSFKAWYVARHDAEAYDELGRVPRLVWADYLHWFRKVLGIKVDYRTRLVGVAGAGHDLELTLDHEGEHKMVRTRKLVLATGLSAGGGPFIPSVIRDNLPTSLFSHTDDLLDFNNFKGRDIGILGASASGFDAAGAALEAGAKAVHVFCRAPALAHGARYRAADFPGADYFHLLDDGERWRVARLYLARGNHPPPSALDRVRGFANFHLHLAAPWHEARMAGSCAEVTAGTQSYVFDHIIAATGFHHDPDLAPELQAFADKVARWEDRYTPPRGEEDGVMARMPYLGAAFQFQEKVKDAAPYVTNIHVLNPMAMPSHLRLVGDVKFLGFASQQLAAGLVQDFFLADKDYFIERLRQPADEELSSADYTDLIRPRDGGK